MSHKDIYILEEFDTLDTKVVRPQDEKHTNIWCNLHRHKFAHTERCSCPFGLGVYGLHQAGGVCVPLVCRIKGFLECVPVIFSSEAGFTLENDGLRGVQFSSASPRHEVPGPLVVVCNTFNFIVEVFALGHFHCALHIAPLI